MNKTNSEQARKDHVLDQKIDMGLLPPFSLFAISSVFTYGAYKYDNWNWTKGKGLTYSVYMGAIQRHLNLWWAGEDLDNTPGGSGLPHLWHVGCNIMMLIETVAMHPSQADDRPKHLPTDLMKVFNSVLKDNPHFQELYKQKKINGNTQ